MFGHVDVYGRLRLIDEKGLGDSKRSLLLHPTCGCPLRRERIGSDRYARAACAVSDAVVTNVVRRAGAEEVLDGLRLHRVGLIDEAELLVLPGSRWGRMQMLPASPEPIDVGVVRIKNRIVSSDGHIPHVGHRTRGADDAVDVTMNAPLDLSLVTEE